jgi:hypothetical protein
MATPTPTELRVLEQLTDSSRPADPFPTDAEIASEIRSHDLRELGSRLIIIGPDDGSIGAPAGELDEITIEPISAAQLRKLAESTGDVYLKVSQAETVVDLLDLARLLDFDVAVYERGAIAAHLSPMLNELPSIDVDTLAARAKALSRANSTPPPAGPSEDELLEPSEEEVPDGPA